MLLKWKADNQLELFCSELFTQYSQLVNKLFVYTEVFDLSTTMSVAFSTFNEATQQWEQVDESNTVMVGQRADTGNGYIFNCYIPNSVMEEAGTVALVVTAQTPTGYTNGNGEDVYQVLNSGLFTFYINKSFNNGQIPIPDNYNELVLQLQDLASNVVLADKINAEATTLDADEEATATVTKNADTGVTNFSFGLPRGDRGLAGEQGIPGRDGYGVLGAEVRDGNLIIITEGITGVNARINEKGELIYEF